MAVNKLSQTHNSTALAQSNDETATTFAGYITNLNNLKKLLKLICVISVLTYMLAVVGYGKLYISNTIGSKIELAKTFIDNNQLTYNLVCTTFNCVEIVNNDLVYSNGNISVSKTNNIEKLRATDIPHISFDNVEIYANGSAVGNIVTDWCDIDVLFYYSKDATEFFNALNSVFIYFFLLLIIVIGNYQYALHVRSIYMRLNNLTNTANKVQVNMSTAIKHEIYSPLTSLKANIKQMYKLLYPDERIIDIAHFTIDESKYKRVTDRSLNDINKDISLSFDRIESVLAHISETKRVKSENGTISLYDIFNNIKHIKEVEYLNGREVKIIDDDNFFKQHSVGTGLSNGELLNIINNLVQNSIEAEASVIKIYKLKQTEKFIDIAVQDNGRGVRGIDGNILKDTKLIFKYGASTKTVDGENIVISCWWKRLLIKLGFYSKYISGRGVGMAISKMVLVRSGVGGDIVLYETSEKGTTFILTLPVKPRRVT